MLWQRGGEMTNGALALKGFCLDKHLSLLLTSRWPREPRDHAALQGVMEI